MALLSGRSCVRHYRFHVAHRLNAVARAASLGEDTPMSGDIDPSGRRNDAMEAFLQRKRDEGYEIESHRGTHAIVAKSSLLNRLRGRGRVERFVVSVDERGVVTMSRAEPKRS